MKCNDYGAKLLIAIMRFTFIQIIFAVVGTCMLYANGSNAQGVLEQKISLSKENTSIENVLKKIERKADIRFVYANNLFDNKRQVSVNYKNLKVDDILSSLLKADGITYRNMDQNFIVLKKARRVTATNGSDPMISDSILVSVNDDKAAPITVKGTVSDAQGPLPGVTVSVVGTKNGVSTGADGSYTIQVPADGALSFSLIGYATQQIAVNNRTNLNVTLVSLSKSLDEVVVVGYGNTRKIDLTGSVGSIKKEAIANVPIVRLDQMIQGKAAGVQVTSVDGSPGTGSSIRIRGGNSINANNEPLYVIDGLIEPDNFNLNQINPQDIESVTILKDASSTAIYGSRGSNGVLLVTTKQGKAGGDNINLNVYNGWQSVPKYIKMLDASQYADLANESSKDNGGPVLYPDPASLGKGTDWQRAITRIAPIRNITLSSSGGSDTYRYYVSGNYIDQRGVIINSGFKRYQFRTNIEKDVRKNVKITATVNIGRSEIGNNTVSLGGQDYSQSALAYSPVAPIYNADGSFSSKKPNDPQTYDNPVVQGTLPLNQSVTNNILGNVGVEWQFIKGLTFKSTFGTSLDFIKNNIYNPGSLPTRITANTGGYADVNTSNAVLIQDENTLTYDKQLGKDHHLSFVAGMSYQTANTETLDANGNRYGTDLYQFNNLSATDQSTFGIGSGYSKYTLFSLLGRINYSYKDKYLLTLTARNDKSSRFAENHKQAFFPALAFGWRLTEEPFIKNLNVFDNLKLRSSFGFNGNQGITPYGSLPRLANTGGYLLGGQKIVGYYASQLSNPNLKWETTRQFDLGLEAGILKGRINIELDYYSKRTKDLLLDLQLPTQTGFDSKLTNIGAISNKGLELSINTVNIKSENFTWETSLNISGNRNKVLDLAGIDNISVNQIYFGGNSTISALQVGQPVGTFWGATYYGTLKSLTSIPKGAVDPNSTHKLGDALYVDKDGDGSFGTGDLGVIGNSNPKYFGGIGNTFTYKKVSLNAYLEGSYGNQVMNIGDAFYNTGDPLTNQFAAIANRWTPANPNSDVPRVNSRQYIPSNRWVYNGSFLRLKSLNVGYTFSGRDLHAGWFKSLYVYVTGTNLFLITKYPYYDPETNAYSPTDPNSGSTILRGFDNTNYPQNRTYAIGVNFTL